jgi:hypothetical protein
MNGTAIPVQELTCQLLDAADGIPADTAVNPEHTAANRCWPPAARRIVEAIVYPDRTNCA